MTPRTISATEAKLNFGAILDEVSEGDPVIIEKNTHPQAVWISIDDYEDFLEIKDNVFQKNLKKKSNEIKKGKFGTLDDLYAIHRKTITKEAQ